MLLAGAKILGADLEDAVGVDEKFSPRCGVILRGRAELLE